MRVGGTQSAFSASLLLGASSLISSLLGLVRGKIIAHLFGAGSEVDAYTAAFELPDLINYLLIGGVASTAFIKILTQYNTEGREEDGDRALSNILNIMLSVLGAASLLGLLLAPLYVRIKFHNFGSPVTAHMCVQMTRILLFNPLLLLAGGVFGSRLMAKKIFLCQALQPLLYNGSIIAGAVFLHNRFGIYSLAMGSAFGALVGMFLLNLIGARSIGMQWTPQYDFKHPAFLQWLKMSLPLMLGQSLTTLDPTIRSYFASEVKGSVSLMNYARQLFNAPMNALGPAAGAASLPFFASLWLKGNAQQFSAAVNRSVSRLMAASLLVTSLLAALALPTVDVTLRGGRFHGSDAATVAQLLILFSLSMIFWTSANLYARAFYAVGNTMTPMISGTIVTVLSIPVYALLFHSDGTRGLVIASDIGIAAHTVALAVLLHKRRMVSLAELEWSELAKALLATLVSAAAIVFTLRALPLGSTHMANFVRLVVGTAVWLIAVLVILFGTKSALPQALLRRRKTSAAPIATSPAADSPDS